jgi:uncharacterized protein
LSEETKTANKFDAEFAKNILLQIKDCFLNNQNLFLKIIWHGGEPLLWGIENYQEIFSFMEKEFSGYKYQNSIQTNLSLINEEYIDLFLRYNVRVGFSLDGTKEIHDSQRVNHNGEGTFDIIMEKVALCKKKKLDPKCIIVATKKHIGKIPKLFQFMCDFDIKFKLNPIFIAGEAKKNVEDYALTPEEYAKMAIELFDLSFFDKEYKITEPNFIEIASNLITNKPKGCMFVKNCQDSFITVSPNGDVFPCGRFCDKDLTGCAYGNLHKESLSDILPKIKSSDIYNRYKYIETSDCKECQYFNICHGGCLHDGFIKSGDFKSKTFLCNAYKKIFCHIDRRLEEAGMRYHEDIVTEDNP